MRVMVRVVRGLNRFKRYIIRYISIFIALIRYRNNGNTDASTTEVIHNNHEEENKDVNAEYMPREYWLGQMDYRTGYNNAIKEYNKLINVGELGAIECLYRACLGNNIMNPKSLQYLSDAVTNGNGKVFDDLVREHKPSMTLGDTGHAMHLYINLYSGDNDVVLTSLVISHYGDLETVSLRPTEHNDYESWIEFVQEIHDGYIMAPRDAATQSKSTKRTSLMCKRGTVYLKLNEYVWMTISTIVKSTGVN